MSSDETRRRNQSRAPTLRQPAAQGPARLVVLEGDRIGRKFSLDGDIILVGRDEMAQVRFDDPQLSRRHAEIRRTAPRRYVIRDLSSSNGTFVNGVPIKQPAPLGIGDKVRFGPSVMLLMSFVDPIEEQLLQRQRLETLGRLGAGIAHDFNNMLSAVLSSIDFVRGMEGPQAGDAERESSAEALADAYQAASRAAGLSQRLLAFAKGEQPLDSRIDVTNACREVARLVRGTFDRSIEIDASVEPKLMVVGNEMDLHQVLMNLCLNARDAMPDGGVLRIHARTASSDERCLGMPHDIDEVLIELADSGLGMSDDTKARAFEPFFTTKREGAGFGLGLATAKEVITNLGGTIELQSERDRGTAFTLHLPAARPLKPTARTSTKSPLDAPKRKEVGPLTVLLVDDEDMVRRSARRVLKHAGHRVLEARDGSQGVACYRNEATPPDVVVLDLDMPVMNGEETLAALIQHQPDALVVMTSGHRDKAREQRLLDLGARSFLRKPWNAGELVDAIIDAVNSPPSSDLDSTQRT